MPIREESFRIGCGRYCQGKGLLATCGTEIARIGTYPLIIGDTTALALTREHLEKSVAETCNHYEIITHDGSCNDEQANELADLAAERGCDVIVGVGGGVIMDFAKVCGHFAECPVVNIPTSSATCAAYTPLSVRYTPEGKTVGTMHFGYEVAAVIVDTKILVKQPVRLFLAGVFDALAKFVEIKQRFCDNGTFDFPIGLDYAHALATHSYRTLCRDTAGAIADMQVGKITPRFENVLFTAIAATGVISGIARGSNQCALAHKFYEVTRTLFPENARPYLHGEIVGVGLLLQNFFNGETANNDTLLVLMKQYGMPHRVDDVGVTADAHTMEQYFERLSNTSAIDKQNPTECNKLREGLRYLWNIA